MSPLYTGPIIDAHHHLWDLSAGRYPWLTAPDAAIAALGDVAFLRHDYLPADYQADGAGHRRLRPCRSAVGPGAQPGGGDPVA